MCVGYSDESTLLFNEIGMCNFFKNFFLPGKAIQSLLTEKSGEEIQWTIT